MIDPKLESLLAEHLKYERVIVNELVQIKFELQNARKLGEARYTIPVKKKGIIQTLCERIRLSLKRG